MENQSSNLITELKKMDFEILNENYAIALETSDSGSGSISLYVPTFLEHGNKEDNKEIINFSLSDERVEIIFFSLGLNPFQTQEENLQGDLIPVHQSVFTEVIGRYKSMRLDTFLSKVRLYMRILKVHLT